MGNKSNQLHGSTNSHFIPVLQKSFGSEVNDVQLFLHSSWWIIRVWDQSACTVEYHHHQPNGIRQDPVLGLQFHHRHPSPARHNGINIPTIITIFDNGHSTDITNCDAAICETRVWEINFSFVLWSACRFWDWSVIEHQVSYLSNSLDLNDVTCVWTSIIHTGSELVPWCKI